MSRGKIEGDRVRNIGNRDIEFEDGRNVLAMETVDTLEVFADIVGIEMWGRFDS